jgi:MFS transporter, YNFM family, putative membrane transport protein
MGFGSLVVVQTPVSAAAAMFCTGLDLCALHNTLQMRATSMAPDAPASGISLFAAVFFLGQASGAAIGGWTFDHMAPSLSCSLSATLLLGLGIAVSRTEKVAQQTADI